MDVVIALDQGTTNTKALAIDETGAVVARASVPVAIAHPAPRQAEQDAEEIWHLSVEVIRACLDRVGARHVAGLAISNQRESVVAWDPTTGMPIAPLLSWHDTRTVEQCAQLASDDIATLVHERTGLPIDPMFSAPKMAWLLQRAAGNTLVGTVDSWLVWKLTGGRSHVIEAGNASRTLLFRLDKLNWDDDLLHLFEVPASALPEVRSSSTQMGVVACDGLPSGLPILAVMADSHAALRGHGGGSPELVKATYGTGSSVMQGSGARLRYRSGIATTLAWLTDHPTYALEGNIRYSGAALDWTARILGVQNSAALSALASTVPDAGGVSLVPAFAGMGAPFWDPSAVGVLTGLTAGATPAHVARAAFDAVAMQVTDVVEAMNDEAGELGFLRADGGATVSTLLMQTQADALGAPVTVAGQADVALYGAAELAFEALGKRLPPCPASATYNPRLDARARRKARGQWSRAVGRARL
ncbi:FGGY-family carbohydrate kinase [Puerhibacterium puerhi]|uniref:FGGY-family carbohydrate kinase n=1 Tax=Puerhibacterium puerhi TaxID=2692623 RepID=UPI0013569500|nr:FGGY family carbohydrate kinase [Puerhibacterium puerhi]